MKKLDEDKKRLSKDQQEQIQKIFGRKINREWDDSGNGAGDDCGGGGGGGGCGGCGGVEE